jgi:hypothetical protein
MKTIPSSIIFLSKKDTKIIDEKIHLTFYRKHRFPAKIVNMLLPNVLVNIVYDYFNKKDKIKVEIVNKNSGYYINCNNPKFEYTFKSEFSYESYLCSLINDNSHLFVTITEIDYYKKSSDNFLFFNTFMQHYYNKKLYINVTNYISEHIFCKVENDKFITYTICDSATVSERTIINKKKLKTVIILIKFIYKYLKKYIIKKSFIQL